MRNFFLAFAAVAIVAGILIMGQAGRVQSTAPITAGLVAVLIGAASFVAYLATVFTKKS
jgi:drug/metabolite transporter (DMT)-like permease